MATGYLGNLTTEQEEKLKTFKEKFNVWAENNPKIVALCYCSISEESTVRLHG